MRISIFLCLVAVISAVAVAAWQSAGPRMLLPDAGPSYLERNARLPDVVTTPSGLQLQTLRPGTGASPTRNAIVLVNYEGSLIDGSIFDSSYERGEPAFFPVGGVIPGFAEALTMMQPGGKYRAVIPSDLAYGREGAEGVIPPNALLIFDVELLEISEPPMDAAPAAEMAPEQAPDPAVAQ